MALKLFNTLSRKKEIFKPLHKGRVGLYTCGPTVYNYAHIGNLRTYIFEDVLRRAFEHEGYRVNHVMNSTDVDDKTIAGAKKAGTTLRTFTRRYETYFKNDLKKLNILSTTRLARATEHIKEMIREIKILKALGVAYLREGSVYFDVSKFRTYGKLSRLDRKGLKKGARVESDEYGKSEAQDFVLWKAKKDSEPSWPSPFGPGRPGWHIECSAMARKYLGQPFDIHAGGVDLVFPHHENEIAQAEAAHQKPFVRYWLHGEHLLVSNQKMSKSLGNMFTLRDIEAEHVSALAFRYFALMAHYRSPLNFTWEALGGAERSLESLYDFVKDIKATAQKKSANRRNKKNVSLVSYQKQFWEVLTDDLNTPQALAVIWELIHEYHKNPEGFDSKAVYRLFCDFDTALGLQLKKVKAEKIPLQIQALLKERERARKERDFAKSDSIRAHISSLGWHVNDTPAGPRLKKT